MTEDDNRIWEELSEEAKELLIWGFDHNGIIKMEEFLLWKEKHHDINYRDWRIPEAKEI